MIQELVKKHGIRNLRFRKNYIEETGTYAIFQTHWYNPYVDSYKVRIDSIDEKGRLIPYRSERYYQSDLASLIKKGQYILLIQNSGAWVPHGAYHQHQCRKNALATMRKRKKK